jgi:predicted metalloprotease
MDWTPGGMSGDIEDRRESSGGFGGMGGGGIGIVGFVILLIISLITGRNYLGGVLSGGGSSSIREPARPGTGGAGNEKREVQLVSFVLDDVQKTWTQVFAAHGRTYRHAKLVLYRDVTYSGCGTAQASTGPFYCPEDEKVYIDLSFWNELKRFGGSTGDFAQAYVVAHELGHHVQKLLGIETRMRRLVQQDPEEKNHLSVDLELQADCLAGVWGHNTEQRNNNIHPEDVDEALKAAAAVGDDHLQRMAGRAVSPERWTHGSSAQRSEWFRRGLQGGAVAGCSTFGGALAP